ncbi:MAG: polysaccharide deacetylase family protein [Verrucomicrobiales bacterium]|nr:polysaccharide deacetylase family protein [Verrucomicrobiales bacterium]
MRLKKKINDGINWLGSRLSERNAVLLYHRVDRKEHDHFNLCVTPENFEEQMSVLAETGSVIPLSEMVEKRLSGQLETGEISITFDDGYIDVLENALPILEKYNLPATLFVTTGNLGQAFWWDTLAAIVRQPETLPHQLSVETVSGESVYISILGRSRDSIFDALYQLLRTQQPAHRLNALDSLRKAVCPETDLVIPRAATKKELTVASHSSSLFLEAHTVTHSRLSALNYEDQLQEICESIDHVSRLSSRSVTSLSYPFGLKNRDYNDDTIRAVEASGLKHAFAADLGVVTPQSPAFAIPRIWAHNHPGSRFKRQMKLWLGQLPSSQLPLSA